MHPKIEKLLHKLKVQEPHTSATYEAFWAVLGKLSPKIQPSSQTSSKWIIK